MKRLVVAVLASFALVLTTVTGSSGTIAFSQVVHQVSDPTDSKGIVRKYTSFADGKKNCSAPPTDNGPCWPYTIGGGKLRITPKTYKLAEKTPGKDYYLLDLTVATEGRYGSKDYAWADVTIKSASKVKSATYSLGKSNVKGCKKYPINIALGWGTVSAGTQVGTFDVDCHSTKITRTKVKKGQKYHITNLNAVKSATFQRFVVVKAGKKPKFKYEVTWPTDSCHKQKVSNGSNTVEYRWCTNSHKTLKRKIGTG